MLKFDGGDQDVYTAPGQRVEGLENIRRVEGRNGKALDCAFLPWESLTGDDRLEITCFSGGECASGTRR